MARGVFGREAELGAVDAVLASARQGLAVLVLEGDPGIGKTTVWRKGMARAVAEDTACYRAGRRRPRSSCLLTE